MRRHMTKKKDFILTVTTYTFSVSYFFDKLFLFQIRGHTLILALEYEQDYKQLSLFYKFMKSFLSFCSMAIILWCVLEAF